MTVLEFASSAISPESMNILVGEEDYQIVSEYSGKLNSQLLEMLGSYIIEDFKANQPNHYAVWVKMRPVKRGES